MNSSLYLRTHKNSFFVPHTISFCKCYIIYWFMTKVNARKIITKEGVFIPSYVRPLWWKRSFEFIVVVLVRKVMFLRVMFFFLPVALIFDGYFENINIVFRFFFIHLLWWLCSLSVWVLFRSLLILIISNNSLNEWWPLEIDDII